MMTFWLECALVLIFGILWIEANQDPFSKLPRIIVEDGNLIIRSGYNRNITISNNGETSTSFLNSVNMRGLAFASNLSQRMAMIYFQLQTLDQLSAQVHLLEDNVTDISQRLSQFVGNDQNLITNRGMRRYFAKINMLEDKVNHLTELLSTNECSSNPCRNGGTCVDSYNGYVCNCPSNWEGPTCENDVNECALYAGTGFGCQNGATCTNLPGSYRCDCPTNWFGIHCTEQHDDCSEASHQELCGHGTCVNEKRVQPGQPKYRCICEPGWKSSGSSPACTEDIDECAGLEAKCSVNPRVLCINLPGTFFCGPCPAGYTGNGLWCEDLNECENNNGGCSISPFVECHNTPGSRRCGPCPNGYFGNGEQCMFQSVCSNNRGGCHPLATCIDNPAITVTYRECRCPPGYAGNGEGLTGCVPTQGVTCANNPCQHGTCQMVGNSYHCVCEAGYYGTNCEVADNPCSRNPCHNGGTCVSGSGTFTCTCPRGYSGPTCANQQRECGGYLTGNNGTLHYPEYSSHYDHEENCAWVISVEEGKVVNITFDHFHLEGGYNCEFDFLQLNDGPNAGSRVIGRFCSDELHGDTFSSTHSAVYLWFRSDRTISATGFTITWKAVDPVCGGVLNESEYGSVRSPGYPGLYPLNRTCSWLVQVPFGKRIQFSFATLMLEHHESCAFDYLKIFDGSSDRDPVIGTYCTTVTPPPLITSGHTATLFFHSDNSVQDSGFNIAYSALPGIEGCGGTLTAPQGIVSSPNFPVDHGDNLECEWLVRIRPNNRIKITFIEFNIEGHRNCLFDSLEIFDGPSDASSLLGKFCGDTLPPEVLSNSHQIYMRFKADIHGFRSGFKLEYKTVCGGVFSDLTGVLTSPFYPDPYGAHTSCIYEIVLPPGNIVNFTIHNIEIEHKPDCNGDSLEVRDGDSGNSPLLARLCGYDASESIISTYNKLWMKFETDGSVQNRGFYAQYEAIDIGCGGIQTDNTGQISSPRHPESYPHNISCTWFLRAPETHIIRLTFTSFVLEHSGTCIYDYVVIEDINGFQIGKYCGSVVPPVITSIDNTLIVKFVADESVARDGFTANYVFLDASEACGGDFYQTSGVIRSPGYPNHYPHSVHCVWVLHAPNSRQITLNVTDFNMEYHSNCKFDFLEIRNGGYKSSPLIGKFCGDQIMPVIRSHSTLLRMEFKTDESMSAPGFEIYFDSSTVGCGGTVSSSWGSIVSPNYPQPYPLNADCQWLIRVSEGSKISLSIVEIDIEEHQTCGYDYLQIFDGSTENSKSLIRICNNQQNPGPILSSSNTALIRFRSDSSEEAGGFHLIYQTLCTSVLTKRRGVIESPNFPNSYPHNHNCSWTIQAPPGSNISISFSHLFIEGGGNCTLDYVEVLETRNSPEEPVLLGKFCGDMTNPPRTITTGSNTAVVNLITDRSISREGFRLEWSFIGCGGDIIDKPYGFITSPNYPNGYPLMTECYWHIWYPPGSSAELTVEDLDLETADDCRFDFLRVYGGEDTQSPRILNACHTLSNSMVVTSHGNEMYVHFASDISIAHRGFRASYRKKDKGCGGYFTAPESTIMSPNFPDPYTFNDECEWLIEVSSANLVMLQFYDFELPGGINCSRGHVAIYDGNNSSAPMLLKHCGGSKPDGFISSTGNQMLVKLVADGTNVAKGFKAHYKEGCGRRLLADNGGEIKSLHYPYANNAPLNCSWIIYSSDIGEKVTLTTTHLDIPQDENCSYASLTIYDGDMSDSPVIGQYCGHHIPPPVVSRSSVLHVFLKNGVFRASYGLLSEHCGGSFTSPSGSFASPGFPTNYDMEMECVWTIEPSPGSKVHISFQSFHLESSDYCNSDYVEIRKNGPSGVFIGKYCGNDFPTNVTSAQKLWIKFRSDDIGTAPGFMAHYELEHGLTITGTSGDIASPGYPHKYTREDSYDWTVIVPEGMFISVRFRKIEITSYGVSSDTICYSHVKIFDGFDKGSPVLGEFCGYTIPEPVFSTGNVITVSYTSMYHPSLFYLRWSAVTESGVVTSDASCLEEHIINGTDRVVIQSPNFPQNYPNEYKCTYMIRTVPTHHVDLQFETFEFDGTYPACNFDKLKSYYAPNPNVDSWNLNSTLCGPKSSVHLASPNNVLKLEMSTDRRVTAQGFKAIAKADCGGQLFGNNGVLRSSSIYANLQNMSTYATFLCEWRIHVRERRTIQLTFDNFDIESDSVCSNNYILIRNGGFSTSPVLGSGRYCGSTPPVLPESSSNEVYIQLAYKPTGGRSPIFDLRYSVVTMGCGGHIYLSVDFPYAEIISPNYPSAPTHDAECDWVVVSPSSTRIRFDFESDIRLSHNCYWNENSDYLEFYDGGTEIAPGIRRFCGYDDPSSVMSTGNALFVRFITESREKQSGFKGSVKIAHCGGTITSMYTTITSPDFPKNYGSSIECEWFLKMSYGYHITLIITEFETPASSNCSLTDYLEIRSMDDEGEVLGTFCGNPSNLPKTIDVPGPEAYVKFKSNSAVAAKGFSMTMLSNFYGEGCGGLFENPSGVITSPRYPNALPYSRDCFWRIDPPPGRRVKITFEELNLPYDENLNTCISYVSVFNETHRYQSRDSNFRYRFCGTTLPEEIDSSSNGMYIAFFTRGLSAGEGFKLRFSTEEKSLCGGELPPPSGVFASPNVTVQNDTYIDCFWKMDAQENQTIAVKFDYLDLPAKVADFCRNSVLVGLADERYLGYYCGNLTSPFMMTSPFRSISVRLLTSLDKPFRGFRATYNVSNCGGVLDGSAAVITSPGYPNNYPPGVDCDWYIQVPYGELIQITFIDFRLEEDCSKDYLMIRSGRTAQNPLLGKFCGSHTVAPISSHSGIISIIFHSDEFGTAPGFKISTSEIQRGCGGLIHALLGNINSPNYPSSYDNNVECVWTIEFAAGYLIKVAFTGRFDIEMDSTCSKDYLQFERMGSDGRWTGQEKKCGLVTPQSFLSNSNKMRIIFHSNDRIVGDGFNLFYQAECGGNFTEPKGDVFSPNYPEMYKNYLNCNYIIGKQGDYISLIFDDYFSIEGYYAGYCFSDYVEIYQREVTESSKQGRYCGSTAPAPRTLLGPVILRFVTDDYFTSHGFKLHYEILNCGAVLTDPSGVIRTPNATGSYINQMDCTWRIIGAPNKVIQLRFLHFDIEESYGCGTDYLEILDGNGTGPSIGRFCGAGVGNVKSTGNALTLRFRSDEEITSKGFAAYYYQTYGQEEGCGRFFNVTTGEISSLDANSDGYYEPDLDCGWWISVREPDRIVKLSFNTFDLQMPSNGTCELDYLEVREFSSSGPVLGRYCGNSLPSPIMTNGHQIFVHFHSDGIGNNAGFRLTFNVLPSPCGTSTLFSSVEAKTLTSPNYPAVYPKNLRCKWTISKNSTSSMYSGNSIEVTVTDIDIPCDGGDYLDIKELRYSLETITDSTRTCGTSPPQVIKIRDGLSVTFNSYGANSGGRGFSLTYKNANCNATYTGDNGIITSDSFPLRINPGFACRINITVSTGRTIALYFNRFDLLISPDCENSYMKVYDGNSNSSSLIATYCGYNVPNPVFSTGNSLYLDVVMPSGIGLYQMTYMTTDKGRGCGGSIIASDGVFSSPLYPQPYNVTGECSWHVSVPPYHTVKLEFLSFALGSTAGCESNYLEIYEGSIDDVSKRIVRYCGQDVPSAHQLLSNDALVKLVTDTTNNQPGFTIEFHARNNVDDTGRINYVQMYENMQ